MDTLRAEHYSTYQLLSSLRSRMGQDVGVDTLRMMVTIMMAKFDFRSGSQPKVSSAQRSVLG